MFDELQLAAGVGDLRHLLRLPSGKITLRTQADTNFQTKSKATTNHDLFEVRLVDPVNV